MVEVLFRFIVLVSLVSAQALSGQQDSSQGIVAYVRDGLEIRLIAPDGANDRLLWRHPRKPEVGLPGIHSLAWHPGGGSLVFSSDHENAQSYYDHDLYVIGLNGTGPHRLTNSPDISDLPKFPKGQVTVTIDNQQLPFSADRTSLFWVYVGGAEKPQMATVSPGMRKTLVFDVAKVTDTAQPVVAIGGLKRWPGPPVRVQAGANVNATVHIGSYGLSSFGAFNPAWRADGTRVAYRFGICAGIWNVPATPSPGVAIGNALAGTGKDRAACAFDWAPAGVSRPPILYSGFTDEKGEMDNSVYQTDEEGSARTRLLHFESSLERVTRIQWLPDGSGFLFARGESRGVETSSNVYRYDFRTKTVTPVTRLQAQHVRGYSVSPDGAWVIYERGKEYYFPSDRERPSLWLIRIDGSQDHLFLANASAPAWGRGPGSRSLAAESAALKSSAASAPGTNAASGRDLKAGAAVSPAPPEAAPPVSRRAEPAPDLSARSMEAVSATDRRDYEHARRVAEEVLRVDPGRKEALYALAASAYGTADFDLFERTAPMAVRNGAGMSFNLVHHHTLTGGHVANLGIKQSTLVFDPGTAKDCNQRAFEEPLSNIVSALQTTTSSGEVFLTLKVRDSQGKQRTLNFADPGSTVDKSGGLPVLREPPDAARRLQALANVIAAATKSSVPPAAK